MKNRQKIFGNVVVTAELCDHARSLMNRRTAHSFSLLLTLLFSVVSVYAQDIRPIDDRVLQSLYSQQLRNPEDQYVQKRITDERARVRGIIEEDLQAAFVPLQSDEEEQLDVAELPNALDRQRSIVDGLTERVNDNKADLDLLIAEEEKYYLSGEEVPVTSTGSIEQFRLTQTHQELLAKKAVLEERVAAGESLLLLQEDRLQKLVFQQRLQQFGVFITVGKYLLILAIIWFIERTIRGLFFARIQDGERRYTFTKFFSAGVYILTIIWLLAVVFSRSPGAVASLAIVGAGLTISLQDFVKDILGWIFIIQNKLYTKGDRVTIGTQTGEVVDIGVFNTKFLEVGIVGGTGALEHTGKILSSPNSFVLTQSVINHNTTSDFVKAEMFFDLTYESNWKKADEILNKILEEETGGFTEREHLQHAVRTRLFYISRAAGKPRVFMDIATDGVRFTLKFTVPIGERRVVVTQITKRVLDAFNAEPDIDLAYKTTRSISEPKNPEQK